MKAWEQNTLKHIVLFFFVLLREFYPGSGPQSPPLPAAARRRLLPQKRRQEPCQFIPAPSEHSTGWGSTLGEFLPEEQPLTKPLPGRDIRIWYPTQMNSSRDCCYLNLLGFDCWEAAKHTGISDCWTFSQHPLKRATEVWPQSYGRNCYCSSIMP